VIGTEPDLNNVSLDLWDHPVFRQNDLQTEVLRLDKIHPNISGNKWFKLKYFLKRAIESNKQTLISFGGAYSNHLLALAAVAKTNGLFSIGYIRGEEPAELSHTMRAAKEYGMEFRFLTRLEYNQKKKSAILNSTDEIEPGALFIPEGGAGADGILGTEEILSDLSFNRFSHIGCAVGTGVTLAGLINSSEPHQSIIGVSVLKGTHSFEPMNISWVKNHSALKNVRMIHGEHFGGYAKKNQVLIDFMNRTYAESGIPTDFVYTGKLFYSVSRMAAEKAFPPGSRILIIHTGGLQGNLSLEPGLLQF
jgi:1-aminocyclopropane-1-carboxylate deaminase